MCRGQPQLGVASRASRRASERNAAIRIGTTPKIRNTESAKILIHSRVWKVPLIR
jgi:hypothetical protein